MGVPAWMMISRSWPSRELVAYRQHTWLQANVGMLLIEVDEILHRLDRRMVESVDELREQVVGVDSLGARSIHRASKEGGRIGYHGDLPTIASNMSSSSGLNFRRGMSRFTCAPAFSTRSMAMLKSWF